MGGHGWSGAGWSRVGQGRSGQSRVVGQSAVPGSWPRSFQISTDMIIGAGSALVRPWGPGWARSTKQLYFSQRCTTEVVKVWGQSQK